MLESTLEKQISAYAKAKDCLSYKWSSPSQRGVPDRIIIAPNGKVLFLELKAPGCKPSKLQQWTMLTIASHGCNVQWVDNIESAKVKIDQLLG